jgi:hypothetical protein
MDIETLRFLERIVIALGGILSIWLGFKLFSIAEIKRESSGTFKSAVATMTVTKVGPGVFFALFGAFILYTGITTTVSINGNAQLASRSRVVSVVNDTNLAIEQLREEIDKLPDGEIKSKLIKMVNSIQNSSIRFIGEMMPQEKPTG